MRIFIEESIYIAYKNEQIGADATLRYRPLRRALYRRLLLRAELVWSRREEVEAAPQAFGLYVAGEYQIKLQPPFIPGSEFAGVVTETAADVAAPAVGTRVSGTAIQGAA